MNVVDIAHDLPGACRKIRLRRSFEIIRLDGPPVNVGHAGLDVLAEHELIPALVEFDDANLSGPVIHILEQMAVNCLKMGEIEIACRDAPARCVAMRGSKASDGRLNANRLLVTDALETTS